MKRLAVLAAAAALSLALSGCGSVFEKEYVSVTDYVPTAQEAEAAPERVTVRNAPALRGAIRDMVYAGQTEGSIAFDAGYDGDIAEDIPTACWQVRTQDALCAYCVQDIRYELTTIVGRSEAKVQIHYAPSAGSVEEIVRLSYATGLERLLLDAMRTDDSRLVILISTSTYSADQMKNLVLDVYHENPACAAGEPQPEVYMYSGTGRQRLYEINLDYGLSEDEVIRRKSLLMNLDVASNTGAEGMDQANAALAACRYLADHCLLTDNARQNTLYDALILGEADSEGVALAYVEMCHQLGLDCEIVYGQRAWQDASWNIVTIDGARYHVDVSACILGGLESGFLRSDESMWGDYRWDTAAYDPCRGALTYAEVAGITLAPFDAIEAEEPSPEETEAPQETAAPEETAPPEETEAPEEEEAQI